MGAGSGGKAARRAEERELEREQAMRAGETRVNELFNAPARQAQYDNFLKALRENFMLDANRQKASADRRLKFALARAGQTGGSLQVDSKRKLGEEFSEGIINAENRAQNALSGLRADDEGARQSLISMIRAGADATSASQRAMSLMSSAAQGAKSRAMSEGLGDVFSATIDTYTRAEDAAARRRGMRDAQQSLYAKPFTTG